MMGCVKQLLKFNAGLGKELVGVLFYIGIAWAVVMLLIALRVAFSMMLISTFAGFGALIVAIGTFAVSVLVMRVTAELCLALFQIADDMRNMRERQAGTSTGNSDAVIGP